MIVAVLRLFASAREAAGTNRAVIVAETVGAVLDEAIRQFGPGFAAVLTVCKVWVNGDPADRTTPVRATDEVAVLPPVSGGSGDT